MPIEKGLQGLLSVIEHLKESLAEAKAFQSAEVVRSTQHKSMELDAVLNSITDGIMLFGPDKSLTNLNTMAEYILGCSLRREHLCIEEVCELLWLSRTGEDRPGIDDMPLIRAFRGETVINEEFLLQQTGRSRKRHISLSAAPIRGHKGSFLGVVATLRDETRKKEFEAQREELMKQIERHASELEEANTALKLQASEIIAKKQALRKAHDELELRVLKRTAELEAANKALKAEINERRRAESRLQQSILELERSNEELRQFAYVSSHDLQEPLRMVASFVQLLAKRYVGKLDEDADTFIGYAVEGAARIQSLIDDLLAYSHVGNDARCLETVDCKQTLETALLRLDNPIRESCAVVTHDSMPLLAIDPTHMVLLFENLIGNAVKFRGLSPPRIHVSAERTEQTWLFSVRDNGIGIDPQYLQRIFVIFQRLHRRENYPGNGMGLAICKKIVERYGGRIWVESEPEKGSTFHFSIPVADSNGKSGYEEI